MALYNWDSTLDIGLSIITSTSTTPLMLVSKNIHEKKKTLMFTALSTLNGFTLTI